MSFNNSNSLRFDGKVVVITGAGAGLGRAYALLFGSRGASVVVNDLGGSIHGDGSNKRVADIVVDEIKRNGGKAVANYDNVLNGDNIIKTAIDNFGRIDILVNNAGILRDITFKKMTDTDWDLIQDVHLKAAMRTTRAAWPYFQKQKFGKIILTSSHSGLYGNFGQANYSAAKMGLVGFANTLAIEGAKSNVYTNVIVPIAASRLTKDFFPPDVFEQLNPEYIAPVVVWLCHDECQENGSIIDSASGWVAKSQIFQSNGCLLRQNFKDMVTPEMVKKNWKCITDMSNNKTFKSIQEVTYNVLDNIEKLKDGNSSSNKDVIIRTKYQPRDAILYALGVGATIEDEQDNKYLYENDDNFSILPTYYITIGPLGCLASDLLMNGVPNFELDPSKILHGEEFLEIHKKLPIEGTIESRFRIEDILDKGKGNVILVKYETYDTATGDKLSTHQMSIFLVGNMGIKAPRNSPKVIPLIDPPKRKPDAFVIQKTSPDQAALYRLNGDLNPIHINRSIANMAGFKKPILHGLCFLGFSVRHVLQTFADNDPDLLKSVKVRFSKTVIPGQTLRTDMWQNGNRIHFQTSVLENNANVITGAYVDLKEVRPRSIKANLCSEKCLESDAVFEQIADYVKSHPDEAKKINGVFHYIVTKEGKPESDWTLNLKENVVYKGTPKEKVDTTLTIDDKDMVQMALGKMNPQVAFMRGKLKIKGNIMLTQKLKTLLDANNKSKL